MPQLSKTLFAGLAGTIGGAAAALTISAAAMQDDAVAPRTTSTPAIIAAPDSVGKALDRKLEFAVYQKNCLACHASVADPERPGKTRDEWYRIITLMQGHGLVISQEEADIVVDLLFALRRGIEDQAG